MKLLALETASEACSVALWLDGELRERFSLEPRAHAGLLLPWVEELLAEAGLALADLDALAFSRGPGSFTSLRLGVSVAQGLAWGAGLGVVPVSSLAATAQAARHALPAATRTVLVALDARMGEVFSARFEISGNVPQLLGAEQVLHPVTLSAPQPNSCFGLGVGFARYPELQTLGQQLLGVDAAAWPRAGAVAELAVDWLRAHAPLTPEVAQPVYLRDHVAEKQVVQKPGGA